jgi:hypothetical protein
VRSRERHEARLKQLEADRETAKRLLASPAGEALIRYLDVLWVRAGLGATPDKTAYRVAFRDAVQQLKDIRQEGSDAA